MVNRGLVAGLLFLASGLLAGCGEADPGFFEGDWASATAGRLSFEDDHWRDGDGDSGTFDYSGEYPEFTMRFDSDAGEFERFVTFADEHTFELCEIGPGGALVNCHEFVYGPYTITPQ